MIFKRCTNTMQNPFAGICASPMTYSRAMWNVFCLLLWACLNLYSVFTSCSCLRSHPLHHYFKPKQIKGMRKTAPPGVWFSDRTCSSAGFWVEKVKIFWWGTNIFSFHSFDDWLWSGTRSTVGGVQQLSLMFKDLYLCCLLRPYQASALCVDLLAFFWIWH